MSGIDTNCIDTDGIVSLDVPQGVVCIDGVCELPTGSFDEKPETPA